MAETAASTSTPALTDRQNPASNSHDTSSSDGRKRSRGRANRGRGRGRGGASVNGSDSHSGPSSSNEQRPNMQNGHEARAPSSNRGSGRGRGRRPQRGRGGGQTSTIPVEQPNQAREGEAQASFKDSSQTHATASETKTSRPSRRRQFGGKITGGATEEQVSASAAGNAGASLDVPVEYTDLRSRLVAELRSGEYDCSICYSGISQRASIWSCSQCYTVLHLVCVKQWASSSVKAAEEQNAMQEDVRIRERKGTWRCPGCQLAREDVPQLYKCWDGQAVDPRPPKNRSVPPHSCGNTCAKASCIHGCSAGLCHPGPCPPCPVTLHHQCFCGSSNVAVRCSQLAKSQTDTRREASAHRASQGISCGNICDQLLACGRHRCTSTCHPGPCNACHEKVEEKCYCGRHTQSMTCGQGERKVSALEDGQVWEGSWQCQQVCDRKFACGLHSCTKSCHPPSPSPPICPRDPSVVKTCPCGAESRASRTSCAEPIELCGRVCGKPYPSCDHTCTQRCHLGECSPCQVPVSVPCRCGESRPTLPCHVRSQSQTETQQDAVLCDHLCRSLRHCGRHECKRQCCPLAFQAKTTGSRKTASSRNPNRPLTQAELDEQDPARLHACNVPCNKPLSCGGQDHFCPLNCHRGPCPPCLRSTFEEVSCHCGRTILEPPVPCGQRPVCRYPCARPGPPCGHPKAPHDCHEDGPCPPCVYLTDKRCDCGQNIVSNIPCHRQKVSCGSICGALKPCGFHRCTATCHSGAPKSCGECTATCGKPKRLCGHPCKARCHAPTRCDESKACDEVVTVSCPCGHLRQKTRCGAAVTNAIETSDQRLKCTDACHVAQRNAKLAEALGLDSDHRKVVAATTSMPTYDQEMLAFYGIDHRFALDLESQFSDFIRSPRHCIVLASASRTQRKFTHELAQAFGLATESLDLEPKRSVQVRRTADARVPRVLPSEVWARAKKEHEAGLTNAAAASSSASRITSMRSSNAAAAPPSPLNALVLEGVFGVDEESLREILTVSVAAPGSNPMIPSTVSSPGPLRLVPFTLKWVGEETVLILPADSTMTTVQKLISTKHEVLRTLRMHQAARSAIACSVESVHTAMPRIVRREDRPGTSTTASSGRSTPNAWGRGGVASSRLSGWAAVAGGGSSAASASASAPMTPSGSGQGRSPAPSTPVREMHQEAPMAALAAANRAGVSHDDTPEDWEQQ